MKKKKKKNNKMKMIVKRETIKQVNDGIIK
jgi:hypothetical protein